MEEGVSARDEDDSDKIGSGENSGSMEAGSDSKKGSGIITKLDSDKILLFYIGR